MNIKDRILAAIKFKFVDRIPTAYRGLPYLSESLMKYFGFKDCKNFIGNYKKLLKKLRVDMWSTGHSPGYFSYFVPKCNYPTPKYPYVKDGAYFYALGVKAVRKTINAYNYNYVFYINPPLSDINSQSELKRGFLTSRMKYFNFNNFMNWQIVLSEKIDRKINIATLNYENFEDSTEEFICMGFLNEPFMICCYLRGMDKFLLDLAFNKKLAEIIIGEVKEFCLEFNKRELEVFGKKAE